MGGLLIVIGLLFFMVKNDWFGLDISFGELAKYWPFLLILAGVAVFFDDRKSVGNPVSVLLIAFTVPLAIYSFTREGVNEIKKEFNHEWDMDWRNGDEQSDNGSYADSLTDGDVREQNYSVPLANDIQKAKLKLGGGAAGFELEQSEGQLFEARTQMTFGNFRLSEEKQGTTHDIDFGMKGKGERFNFNEDTHNEVLLKLNTKPIWDIEMGIGAGDLNFDLSEFKIENLEIKTGAADLELKLGQLLNESNVKIESGAASIRLQVPEVVGCKIDMDGALNSSDFEGFEKRGDDYYSKGYDKATKKINMKISSGLSSVKVSRY